jgi:hypothetical protein
MGSCSAKGRNASGELAAFNGFGMSISQASRQQAGTCGSGQSQSCCKIRNKWGAIKCACDFQMRPGVNGLATALEIGIFRRASEALLGQMAGL